jgi:hypothetical protein
MKKLLFLTSTLLIFNANAQTLADFEDFNLGVDSFLNGSDLQGGFANGNIFLPNTYDTDFLSWYGFSVSSMTDITTASFTNEFSCIAGAGYNNSETYAVAYMSYLTNNVVMHLQNEAAGGALQGIYVNNTTYAALSMKNGDAIAKKFGGISGNDPDFFLLTIKKYLNGQESTQKMEFYLADYRFSDNSQDYIIDEWTYIDLTSLGNADSISFSLSSSDVGQFGMNTPAYFCLDNISTLDSTISSLSNLNTLQLSFFPNPTKDFLNLSWSDKENLNLTIFNALGQIVIEKKLMVYNQILDLQSLQKGMYFIYLFDEEGNFTQESFIKE